VIRRAGTTFAAAEAAKRSIVKTPISVTPRSRIARNYFFHAAGSIGSLSRPWNGHRRVTRIPLAKSRRSEHLHSASSSGIVRAVLGLVRIRKALFHCNHSRPRPRQAKPPSKAALSPHSRKRGISPPRRSVFCFARKNSFCSAKASRSAIGATRAIRSLAPSPSIARPRSRTLNCARRSTSFAVAFFGCLPRIANAIHPRSAFASLSSCEPTACRTPTPRRPSWSTAPRSVVGFVRPPASRTRRPSVRCSKPRRPFARSTMSRGNS